MNEDCIRVYRGRSYFWPLHKESPRFRRNGGFLCVTGAQVYGLLILAQVELGYHTMTIVNDVLA
jgi:hypothetical protein